MTDLASRECIPCKGGVPPLTLAQMEPLLADVPQWRVQQRPSQKHGTIDVLGREYAFKNFAEAMTAAVKIGDLAEAQQHHPDLHVAWGKLGVEIWTHKIGGLTESDFVFAAKCDREIGSD